MLNHESFFFCISFFLSSSLKKKKIHSILTLFEAMSLFLWRPSLSLFLSSSLSLFLVKSAATSISLCVLSMSQFIYFTQGDKNWYYWQRFLHQKSPLAIFKRFPTRFPCLRISTSFSRLCLTMQLFQRKTRHWRFLELFYAAFAAFLGSRVAGWSWPKKRH